MGLRDYKPRTSEVKFSGGSITVRGLTPSEVSELIKEFKDDAIRIYEVIKTMDIGGMKTDNDFFTRMIAIISDIPSLVSNLIALSCDEPESADLAAQLPLAIQYDAICQIGALTFTVDGDLKKLVANMITKLGGINGVLTIAVQTLDQIVPKKPSVSGVGD